MKRRSTGGSASQDRRPTRGWACRATAIVILGILLGAAGPAVGDESAAMGGDPGKQNYPGTVIPEILVEFALLRPLGAAATIAGMPMFVASVPFMIPSGDYAWSWDVFVMAPFDYTFTRPLRDF